MRVRMNAGIGKVGNFAKAVFPWTNCGKVPRPVPKCMLSLTFAEEWLTLVWIRMQVSMVMAGPCILEAISSAKSSIYSGNPDRRISHGNTMQIANNFPFCDTRIFCEPIPAMK